MVILCSLPIQKKSNPQIEDKDILPATLSYELTTKLLKEQLGFKGLVVTDASTMAAGMRAVGVGYASNNEKVHYKMKDLTVFEAFRTDLFNENDI